jgi:uncharacterized protein YfiM (DUF2279 family)
VAVAKKNDIKIKTKNKMNIKQLYFLMALIGCAACGKDPVKPTDSTTVALNIRAVYAAQPFIIGAAYPYRAPSKIRFDNLTFYLSNIELIGANGAVTAADNLFCDLSKHHNTAAGAAAGETLTLDKTTAAATYTAIRFGVGVAPAFNARSWTSYPNGNALANADYYWSVWNSFIFAKIEGKMDTLGTAVQYPIGFSYHTGTDSLYRTVTVPIAATVVANTANTIPITLDVQQLFLNAPLDTLDIRRAPVPRIPPVSNPDIMALHHIVVNFARAFR